MSFARFVIIMSLLPGVLPAQDTAQLARAGQRTLNGGAYTTAVYLLRQVVTAEPKQASAWGDLCRAYLELDQIDAAVDTCLRQIDMNPQISGVHGALGAALWQKGKRDEAISAFQQQAEVDRQGSGPHVTLGHYYCELERCLALGQTDMGLAMLNKLAQIAPRPPC